MIQIKMTQSQNSVNDRNKLYHSLYFLKSEYMALETADTGQPKSPANIIQLFIS